VAYNGTLKDEWELAKVWKEVVVFSWRYYSALPKKKTTKIGMADDRSIFQVCIS